MKKLIVIAFALAISPVLAQRAAAADQTEKAPAADVKGELKELINKINTKLEDGKRTEADLADELKAFDAIIAKHKNEKTDEVAQISFMKAILYLQVFDDTEKGVEMIKQLKLDFAGTQVVQMADGVLESVAKQAEAKKIQSALAIGSKFPDFEEKDLKGQALSIAKYKGKVVLIDFWATWCGPCVAELPNVLEAYEKYNKKGFEIIGISLDKDKEALTGFIKKRKMAWAQFFDGQGWGNKLAVKYGVNSIPATYLLDGNGKIIGKDLRGKELSEAVAKALPKK